MEHDEPVYSGFLLLPPGGKILIKKSWQQKFCLLFKSSKFGIERLEVYDTVDTTKGTPSRIITLENVIKITPRGLTHFAVLTKNSSIIYEFGTMNIQSKNEWLGALQSVAFPDDISKTTSIEEDNDLYCSSGEGVFNVKIHSSPASERCGLDNKTYTMVLTSTAIQLRNSTDNTLLYTWPYCFIRRYGYKNGKFTFEAGRKCDSGEGIFFLEHSNQQEIFRCVASRMKSMKQLLKCDSTTTTTTSTITPTSIVLDCGDNQFHAALNMEARSRSPLPPSPTTSTSLHDIDSNLSRKSLNIFDSDTTKQNAAIKAKPTKPPRKSIQTNKVDYFDSSSNNSTKTTIISDYEPIDKYDHVQYRSDAWRTMGVDDIKHTENMNNDEEEEYFSWGALRKTPEKMQAVIPIAPKIITQSSSYVEDNYDKLNFFGSSSKLNNVKSGYKQVSPAPAAALPNPTSFNDYDEVQPAMEGIRLADDSHLGYALIRKELPYKDDSVVNHQIYNNDPYAVISKPKRV